MSARRDPRFEIVHTDAGHFARFIASNGKEVWRTSETYKRRNAAIRAVEVIAADSLYYSRHSEWPEVCGDWSDRPIEVRFLDERPKESA